MHRHLITVVAAVLCTLAVSFAVAYASRPVAQTSATANTQEQRKQTAELVKIRKAIGRACRALSEQGYRCPPDY